jgi:hypothetical protein
MAVERRDPVPIGRYWIFLKTDELDAWQTWVHDNAGKVFVVSSETQITIPDGGILWATRPDASIIKDAQGEWILFDVRQPVKWIGFGFPTIVTDPNVRSSSDVMTAPAPETGGDVVSVLESVKSLVTLGVFAFVGIQLFKALQSKRSSRVTARG